MRILRFISKFSLERRRRVFYGALLLAALLVVGVVAVIGHYVSKTDEAQPIPIAAVLPLTGQEREEGKEILQSIQLYINSVNDSGGVNGQALKLTVFDDRNDPKLAAEVARKVADSSAVLVLGHWGSASSTAAGEFYKADKIPAMTSAFADNIAQDNPYYFQINCSNSKQVRLTAAYIQSVLHIQTATAIYATDILGLTASEGFESKFGQNGKVKQSFWYDSTRADRKQQMEKIVKAIAADTNPGVVFLGVSAGQAKDLLVEMKRGGVQAPLFGAAGIGRDSFSAYFHKYPEEQKNPGFFTEGLYASSPSILDSANADTQDFVSTYASVYGIQPGWPGANYYDATRIAVEAIKAAQIKSTNPRQQSREQIRAQLVALDRPATAFHGLAGPIYFKDRRNATGQTRFGHFQEGKFISESVQVTPIANLSLVDQQREQKLGNLLQLDDELFWQQRVVYTGIDINQLSQIDQRKSSFTADFYLWFRYPDGADATNINFPGGTNIALDRPLFEPDKPLEAGRFDGLNYRLYQIRGEFKAPFNLQDYPFDQQNLTIQFQNNTTPSDRLIYAIDRFGLRLPNTDREAEQKPYQALQLWKFQKLQYAQQVLRTNSTEGDPRLFGIRNQVDYPGLSATVTLQRRSVIFLSKNLLPLFLLMLVPMTTLYFPDRISKDRPPVAVAALISGTVLLVGMNNQLPDVGYIIAQEYVFYIFFGLSLFAVAVAIVSDRFKLKGDKLLAKRIDYVARIVYVLIMAIAVVGYWTTFSNRLS